VDNELSATDRAAVEKHFEVCAHCANERFQIVQMNNTLQSEFAYSSPYGLKDDIKTKLTESLEGEINHKKSEFSWGWLSYVVPPVVTGLAAILLVFALLPHFQQKGNMEVEIISAHVRSLMEDNLTHIDTSNPQKIQPWFTGKVDFVPNAKDLTNSGFKLIGARLDYVNRNNAASIVYQTQNHLINLFIFPRKQKDMLNFKTMQNRGYNIIKWTSHGLEYCVISDLNMEELKQFAQLYRERSYNTRLY
jgi:anti-sigma factor RsiW